MNQAGTPPQLAYLDIDDLWVNTTYQRGTDSDKSKKVIRHIAAHFDWSMFQPILVAKSPGGKKYSIIDGQHRVLAALERGDIEQVPCCIVDLPDIARQAESFVSVNKVRVALHPMQIFRAACAAGEKNAVALKEFLSSMGVSVPSSPVAGGCTKPNQVQAIGTLERIFKRKNGKDALTFALGIILKAYPAETGQMRSMLIQCLAEVFFRWGGVSENIVIGILQDTDAETLQDVARSYHKEHGGGILKAMVAQFAASYNDRAEKPEQLNMAVRGE